MRQLAVLSVLWFAACQSQGTWVSAYPELRAAMGEFQVEQARFLAANTVPQKFDFPGSGTVTVRDISLDGYPGNTYVRARLLYQNTTGHNVVRAWVGLDVLDAQDRLVASQVSVFIIPTAVPIMPDCFFSDELRTKTMDAHQQPGWRWRVTCKVELEE